MAIKFEIESYASDSGQSNKCTLCDAAPTIGTVSFFLKGYLGTHIIAHLCKEHWDDPGILQALAKAIAEEANNIENGPTWKNIKKRREGEMIPETVVLAFDPKKSESKELREVFSDDLARTLWLAVKSGHLTDSNFNRNCLTYAKIIRDLKKKEPMTADLLFRILSGFAKGPGQNIIGSAEASFAAKLLPFINGEKTISFTVNLKRQSEEMAFQERASGLGPDKPN
jgi:hypothetical protein